VPDEVASEGRPSEPTGGYLSEDSKRRFTLVAGLLGAGFFVAQMALPMALMLLVFFPAMSLQEVTTRDVDRAALWKDELWFVERTMRLNWRSPDASPHSLALGRVRLTDLSDAGPPLSLDVLGKTSEPWLVGAGERLWVIAADAVGYYERGSLTRLELADGPAKPSSPFVLEGRPAVLSPGIPAVLSTLVVDGDRAHWDSREVPLGLPSEAGSLRGLQAVEVGDRLYLLAELCTDTPNRCALHLRALDEDSWRVLVDDTCSCATWNAIRVGSDPTVFLSERQSDGTTLERVVRVTANGPRNEGIALDAGRRPGFHRWRAFSRAEEIVLVSEGMPGGLKVAEVQDGRVVRSLKKAGSFPFMPGMLGFMIIVQLLPVALSLVLALLLTVQMRRHRVATYALGEERRTFASLWQRALAQLVDLVPLAAGLVPAGFFMWRFFADPESLVEGGPFFPFAFFALFAAAFLWCLLVIAVYSYLEGRFGKTPGKWLVRIRVLGMDLRPCGFGRALVRNLLTFVDGFFNFLVGALLVALTESWQRLGDLAARTIVVLDDKTA
jgi:uncharacterized RDD family membrane protein YckC